MPMQHLKDLLLVGPPAVLDLALLGVVFFSRRPSSARDILYIAAIFSTASLVHVSMRDANLLLIID